MKYWICDPLDREVEPFERLRKQAQDAALAEETIENRPMEKVWIEIDAVEGNGSPYVSTEFIAYDSSGKMRSFAGLRHLSSHCLPRHKKISTLE